MDLVPVLITTTEDLNSALAGVSGAEFVAVDTEFMRRQPITPNYVWSSFVQTIRQSVLTLWLKGLISLLYMS